MATPDTHPLFQETPEFQSIKEEVNSEGFNETVNPDGSGHPFGLIIGTKKEANAILKQFEKKTDSKTTTTEPHQETSNLPPNIREHLHNAFPFLKTREPNTLEQNMEILRKFLPILVYDFGPNKIENKTKIVIPSTLAILKEEIRPDPVSGLCELLEQNDLTPQDYYVLLTLLRLFGTQAASAMPIIMKKFDLFEVMAMDIHEQAVNALQEIGSQKKEELASFFIERAFKIAKPRIISDNGVVNFYFLVYCEILNSMQNIAISKILNLAKNAKSQGDQDSLTAYFYIYKKLKGEESKAEQKIAKPGEAPKKTSQQQAPNRHRFLDWWPFNRQYHFRQ